MKTRRLLSIILSLVMILTALPLTAVNSFAETSGDFEYSVHRGGTASITKYNGFATELKIPSELDGHSVVDIDYRAFAGCKSIKSIEIPDSIIYVGYEAFANCSSLMSITIPDSVATIREKAFNNCASLTKIKILGIVKDIGSQAFLNTEYYNNDNNWDNGVLYIGNHLIKADNDKLSKNCKIKDGTLTIADNAFKDCISLKNIEIPDSIIYIGNLAFNECTSIENITIPDSVSRIGFDAFSGTAYYNNLKNWENGVLYIGKHLIDIMEEYDDEGYPLNSLPTNYEIKSDTITIADYAFEYRFELISITIPSSVNFIGNNAFLGCESLKNIAISDGVKSIGNWAFGHCESLKSVIIPQSIENIGENAFLYCNNLKSVTIYSNNIIIGDTAFGYSNKWNEELNMLEKIKDFTIYGYAGTEAERYANDNGFKFIDLNKESNILGDLDGDNEVAIKDAKWVLQSVANTRNLTAQQKLAADVNGDGDVTIVDAKWILQAVAGIRNLSKK